VGTALSAIILAKGNPNNQIIGIDLSPDMLAVARKKVQKQGLHNLTLQEMDATKMKFQNGMFDVVMISFGLHEMDLELMVKVLKEAFRVLKSKGQLLIIDYSVGEGLIENHLFRVFLRIFEPNHMPQFLKYDWEGLLEEVGYSFKHIRNYLFSKLILATKYSKEDDCNLSLLSGKN
jgi:demethylmenaquinone methyltransferase/2-methoxy-6-polyprenyl-1,4-benzoquinol methylase